MGTFMPRQILGVKEGQVKIKEKVNDVLFCFLFFPVEGARGMTSNSSKIRSQGQPLLGRMESVGT